MFQKIKDILNNELLYISSDILIKAIGFLSLPLFVNKMTTSEYGEFSLYLSYISIISIFLSLNIQQGIVKYYIDKDGQTKYLITPIWINITIGIFGTFILWSLNNLFAIINFSSSVLILISITAIFTGIKNIGLECIRADLNAKLYAFISISSSVVSTLLGLTFVFVMNDNLGYWRLISISITTVFFGVALVLRIIKLDGFRYNSETARYLLIYSIPLIPYALSSTIISQVNKIFLASISLSDVGVYSFASSLAMLLYIIAISLNRAFQPILFTRLKNGKSYIKRMYQNIVLFYFCYLGFVFFNDILINIFGNKDYSKASNVIPILCLGYGFFFLYSLFVNYFYYYKKNFLVSSFSIVSAIIVLIGNTLLIPKYGYYGAALSTMLSYFSLFLIIYIYTRLKLRIHDFKTRNIIILNLFLIVPVVLKYSFF